MRIFKSVDLESSAQQAESALRSIDTPCARSVVATVLAIGLLSTSLAHEPAAVVEAAPQSGGRAVLAKIERFQSSVKQKLRDAWRPDRSLGNDQVVADHSDGAQQNHASGLPATIAKSHRVNRSGMAGSIPADQYHSADRRQSMVPSQADGDRQYDDANRSNTGPAIQYASTPQSHRRGASRNMGQVTERDGYPSVARRALTRNVGGVNPIQYSELPELPGHSANQAFANGNANGSMDALIPAPVESIPGQSLQRYPTSSADTFQEPGFPTPVPRSFVEGPAVAGIRLGQGQITATERALALLRENDFLRASRDNVSADNKRLREILKTTQELLGRSDVAMKAAQVEISKSDVENRRLQSELTALQTKHKRYLMDTDRMLTSLREELDEVLVSELNQRER